MTAHPTDLECRRNHRIAHRNMARPAVTRTFWQAPACLREGTSRWNQALARAAPMPGATDGAMRALTTHHEGRNLLLRVFRTRRR